MSLDIQRIPDPDQFVLLAEPLAGLQNAGLPDAPHCRPVTAEELIRRVRCDRRFGDRAILVAYEVGTPVGWCHLEPPSVALTGGDLYPYVGGHTVFQPGLPHIPSGAEYSPTLRALLYAACQVRAQQGASSVELFAPVQCPAERELRAAGFESTDVWATYVSDIGHARPGRAPLHVSSVRPSDAHRFVVLLIEAGLIHGEFTPDDLLSLMEAAGDFDSQSLLLAETEAQVVGYAAVVIDPSYVAATGRRRAWFGFGPLGMAALRGPEHPERIATLISGARISAFCRGATELALVASAERDQTGRWADRGFTVEVRWRRWVARL